METDKIIINGIRTPDGTVLISHDVHDFKSHIDSITGEKYFVDGGKEYCRRSVNNVNAEPIYYVLSDIDIPEKWLEIRKIVCRGTFDEDGNRIWKPINEMSDEHLKNCIIYNNKRFGHLTTSDILYQKELDYRKENNITIIDNYNEKE